MFYVANQVDPLKESAFADGLHNCGKVVTVKQISVTDWFLTSTWSSWWPHCSLIRKSLIFMPLVGCWFTFYSVVCQDASSALNSRGYSHSHGISPSISYLRRYYKEDEPSQKIYLAKRSINMFLIFWPCIGRIMALYAWSPAIVLSIAKFRIFSQQKDGTPRKYNVQVMLKCLQSDSQVISGEEFKRNTFPSSTPILHVSDITNHDLLTTSTFQHTCTSFNAVVALACYQIWCILSHSSLVLKRCCSCCALVWKNYQLFAKNLPTPVSSWIHSNLSHQISSMWHCNMWFSTIIAYLLSAC